MRKLQCQVRSVARLVAYWVVIIVGLSVWIDGTGHAQTLTEMTRFDTASGQAFNTRNIKELQDWGFSLQFPQDWKVFYATGMVWAMNPGSGGFSVESEKVSKEYALPDYLADVMQTIKTNAKTFELISPPADITINGIPAREFTFSATYQFGSGERETRYVIVFVSGKRGYSFACQAKPAELAQAKKNNEPVLNSLKIVK